MAHRCNCDSCVADPRVVCSYTGDDVSVPVVYVANAYRGHLILSPGGPAGQIGGLLHQLDPPQHYSHMGIVVNDFDLFRHSTASPGRLTADEYYTGSILGVSAPVDGLNPDHVQYGWPGTVTQSAEQVFFADRYSDRFVPPGTTDKYRGADLVDPESPSQKSYRIAALSFDGVFDDGTWYPALVVKPCPLLETPALRTILGRVADEAMKLYGHYRFYCYSNSALGEYATYWGLPTDVPDAQPDWDPVGMKWRDWSDPSQVKTVHKPTIPSVCSSFIWQAVREVSKHHPKIVLDWAQTHDQALGPACKRAVAPDWRADIVDAYTLDGLFLYDETSRKRAADWLHDSISDEVFSSLKGNLADQGGIMKIVAAAIDDVGRPSFIAAAEGGVAALMALLTPVVGPVVAGAIDAVIAEQLIELLYDMPDDIANQMCTSFAFDCHRGFPGDSSCVDAAGNEITDVDSSNWSDAPGDGHAVSPDNIHMFWDAPGPSDDKQLGLYGHNVPVQLVAAVVRRPVCELVPSTGTATLRGFVRYRGRAVAGAYVKVNCQTTTTGPEGDYQFTVRSGGQFKVVARFEDTQRGIVAYGERTTGRPGDPPIAPNTTVNADITLIDPPVCLRNVVVEGTVRVDDVYFTGADHAETPFRKTFYVQAGVASFDENAGKWVVDPNDPAAAARKHDVAQVGASVGDADGELKIEVIANDLLTVDVTVTGTIGDLSETHSVLSVTRNTTVTIAEFSLDTGGPFNDRAYFRGLTITNNDGSAI